MIQRQNQMLEIVNQEGKIDVNSLAERVGVSAVTVRKDLDALAEMGLLIREHGYALRMGSDDINNRLAVKYEIKAQIAKKAASFVRPGETVMIESGSSCALLAGELAGKKDVTIITNSAFIAGYVRDKGSARIVLLGGEYQRESQVMVGPLVHTCARSFHVDKLFIGVDGFDPEYGFSTSDMMRTDAMKGMAQSAEKLFVLTDSEKFSHPGLIMELAFEDVYAVITDDEIPSKARQILQAQNIQVITPGM